jgi:glycosyltransferase involved in cell wall biosynthesis
MGERSKSHPEFVRIEVSISQHRTKEGLPLSLVEAIGAGLAIVASDLPGHRDFVIRGETGLAAPPAAMADTISSFPIHSSAR